MDELVQKIGLGTVQFGIPYGISNQTGQTSSEEVSTILDLAREKGIQVLDTASAYGNAEKILGQNNLSAFKLVSKFMPPEDGSTISDQLAKSLDDLGIASLYGYLAHRPDHLAKNLHLWNELISLKENGNIQKIGLSLNRPEELEKLLKKGIVPDIIQVPFNYFDRRFKKWMISLKDEGCEIHTRSAFLQGLFFMDVKKLDSHFVEVVQLLEHLQKNVHNLPGALLNFVLEQPFTDTVVVGVENRQQFIENLESVAMFERLPELRQDISESIVIPSTWPK